jgi:hypothetical protein
MNFGNEFKEQMQTIHETMGDMRAQTAQTQRAMDAMAKEGLNALSKSLRGAQDSTRDFRSAFQGMMTGLLKDLTRYGLQNMRGANIQGGQGLASLFGEILGGRAKGGMVAAGGAYVVGENGPELLRLGRSSGAVMPLAGNGSQGAVHIQVINNTPSQITSESRARADGGRDIIFMIDEMMAQTLAQSDSKASRLLKSRYGLSPQLSQR